MVFACILVVLVKVEIFYGKKACKICNRCYLNTGSELSLLTITDDRIFIEKLATFFEKANAAQAGQFLNVEEHHGACPTLSYCF